LQHIVVPLASLAVVLQLEAAQGGHDDEAAAALAELKATMSHLAYAEAMARAGTDLGSDVPDEVQLASVLDRSVFTPHSCPQSTLAVECFKVCPPTP
jgi:hypothetical protein